MVKLVITDIDKTLLCDDGMVSLDNINAIKKLREKGVKFGVASGRAEHVLKGMMSKIGLLEYLDLIISYNGVVINDETVLDYPDKYYLKRETILSVYDRFKHEPVTFIVHKDTHIICNKQSPYSDLESNLNGYDIKVNAHFSEAITSDFPKLMLVGSPEHVHHVFEEMIKNPIEGYNYFKSHENFLEVVSPNVSKGNILRAYCQAKGIKMSEVMAIGDNLNDLDMIKFSGYGIAVENAVEELKLASKWITTSNNESGVAKAIEKYL